MEFIKSLKKKIINQSKTKKSIKQDTPDHAAAAAAASSELGSYRDAPPAHFTFKIQSFSLLATSYMKKFESNEFEAGGYKWRLVFYPKVTSTSNISSTENVSMYLKIVDTESLPRGWLLDVSFRFFVLDQVRDKYLIIGDMGGRTRRFHEMKTMWGYNQPLPLTTLTHSSNGFLVDDALVFGAEVFPCKHTGCGGSLTMAKSPIRFKYTWRIENFSTKIKEKSIESDVFNAGEHKWKVMGESSKNNEYLTLCLGLDVADIDAGQMKVYARFKLRVRDQLDDEFDKVFVAKGWFFWPQYVCGCFDFMRLDELNDERNGYLVKDTCIVEAEVTVLGEVSPWRSQRSFISLI